MQFFSSNSPTHPWTNWRNELDSEMNAVAKVKRRGHLRSTAVCRRMRPSSASVRKDYLRQLSTLWNGDAQLHALGIAWTSEFSVCVNLHHCTLQHCTVKVARLSPGVTYPHGAPSVISFSVKIRVKDSSESQELQLKRHSFTRTSCLDAGPLLNVEFQQPLLRSLMHL